MDTEVRQGNGGAGNRGGWYFIRGIPIAVIFTLVGTIGGQTLAFVLYLKGLEAKVEKVDDKQTEHGLKLDKTDGKLDALSLKFQDSNVPAALNASRITAVESAIAELRGRVSDNERKLLRLEATQNTSEMRRRAERDR